MEGSISGLLESVYLESFSMLTSKLAYDHRLVITLICSLEPFFGGHVAYDFSSAS